MFPRLVGLQSVSEMNLTGELQNEVPLGSHYVCEINLSSDLSINTPVPKDEGVNKSGFGYENMPQITNKMIIKKSCRPGEKGISQGDNQGTMGMRFREIASSEG